jgi:Skp family chaperone for outer membrane proteins
MNMKHMLAAAVLVPGMFAIQSTGNVSVAVVNFDRAVAETAEGKAAISKLTQFGTERRTAIESRIKQAEDMADRLRTQGRIMSESARDQLTKDLETAQTEIDGLREDAQNKIEQMREQLLAPVEQKTARTVSAYAIERGFRVVLDSSALGDGLVYVHDTADITTEIMRRLVADMRKSTPSGPLFGGLQKPDKNMARVFHRQWLDVSPAARESDNNPAGSVFASRRIAGTSFLFQP